MSVTLIVHLYAVEGNISALRAFEAKVLPVVGAHGGKLLTAFTPSREIGTVDDLPDEIHILSFPSVQEFHAYRNDPSHQGLAAERARAIRKTTVVASAEMITYD